LGSAPLQQFDQSAKIPNGAIEVHRTRCLKTVHQVVTEGAQSFPEGRCFRRNTLKEVPFPVISESIFRRELKSEEVIKSRPELQELACLGVERILIIDLGDFAKEVLEERLGDLKVRLYSSALDGDAVPRMIELIAESVVPLDIAQVDTGQPWGSVLIQQVQKTWKRLTGGFEISPPRPFASARTLGQSQVGLDGQFDRVVDANHCDSPVEVLAQAEVIGRVLQQFAGSISPRAAHLILVCPTITRSAAARKRRPL
jgi:hypothetical protein